MELIGLDQICLLVLVENRQRPPVTAEQIHHPTCFFQKAVGNTAGILHQYGTACEN